MENTSIATDHQQSTGSPRPHLQAIAGAGFTHVHWCHQWNTDFLYCTAEIDQIRAWLDGFGLEVTDIHASAGQEKCWASLVEYERLAGVQLVANRMEMAADLGCDVIVLHVPEEPEDEATRVTYWDCIRRSLDTLREVARTRGVRIALENGATSESWIPIARILTDYPPTFTGLCYDSGHGNISGDGLKQLEVHADRLLAVHLHDNDGTADQHKLPFSGTVDWDRLVALIARSSYDKWVNLEVSQRGSGYDDEEAFLSDALAIARRLAQAVADAHGPGDEVIVS